MYYFCLLRPRPGYRWVILVALVAPQCWCCTSRQFALLFYLLEVDINKSCFQVCYKLCSLLFRLATNSVWIYSVNFLHSNTELMCIDFDMSIFTYYVDGVIILTHEFDISCFYLRFRLNLICFTVNVYQADNSRYPGSIYLRFSWEMYFTPFIPCTSFLLSKESYPLSKRH